MTQGRVATGCGLPAGTGVLVCWYHARVRRATSLASLLIGLACTYENPAFSLRGELEAATGGDEDSTTRSSTTRDSTSAGSSSTGSDVDSTTRSHETATSASASAASSTGQGASSGEHGSASTSDSDTGHTSEDKVVFVSGTSFVGTQIDGLEGADELCQQLADEAGLEGTFRAWLSDSTGTPASRMTFSTGDYRLVDDTLIAQGWQDLLDGELIHPIDVTEDGSPAPDTFICQGGEVWSNTTADGQLQLIDQHCEGWGRAGFIGATGNHGAMDGGWTASSCTNVTCSSALPIYCFEQ